MGLPSAQERDCRSVHICLSHKRYPPPCEEVRHLPEFPSQQVVSRHMEELREQSCFQSSWKGGRRHLHLLPLHTGGTIIPFRGTVAAGSPIEPVEVPESIEIPASFLGNGQNFALKVRGDSMAEEGIREGDILIVSRRIPIVNGRTVVALVNGDATVKKFYQQGDEVELRPANSQMKTIRVPAGDVEIVGTVVGLLRHYRPRSVLSQ